MFKILLIMLGGAAGTMARYGTSVALHPFVMRIGFPLATLFVNLLGCLLIGLLGGYFLRASVRPDVQLMLTVGFLGGYTTFSSFALEVSKLVLDGHILRAVVYVAVSNIAGIFLAMGGFVIARKFFVV